MKHGKRLIFMLVAVAALVVGCGGSSDTQAGDDPAPSASAAPSTGHAAETGEPELIAVPGFDYGDDVGPAGQVCDLFSEDMISECSVHTVTELGNGYLFVMGFAPDVPLSDTVAADMVKGMSTAGGRVKVEKVEGEDVALIDAGDGKTADSGLGSRPDDVHGSGGRR